MSDLENALMFWIKTYRLPEPVREHVFAKPRRWRFDFAWPEQMVAAEVEGGTFMSGRHTRGAEYEKDCEKYNTAVEMGWRVLRFTKHMVNDTRAVECLSRVLDHKM